MEDNTPHILIVDDELSMRELLEVLLAKEGYKATCAKNGRDAISMIKKTVFDLLLCDIRLGDITGIDVLRALKEVSKEVDTIFGVSCVTRVAPDDSLSVETILSELGISYSIWGKNNVGLGRPLAKGGN